MNREKEKEMPDNIEDVIFMQKDGTYKMNANNGEIKKMSIDAPKCADCGLEFSFEEIQNNNNFIMDSEERICDACEEECKDD